MDNVTESWRGDVRFVEIYRKNYKKPVQFFAADTVSENDSHFVFYLKGNEVARCNKVNCFYKPGAVVNFFQQSNKSVGI